MKGKVKQNEPKEVKLSDQSHTTSFFHIYIFVFHMSLLFPRLRNVKSLYFLQRDIVWVSDISNDYLSVINSCWLQGVGLCLSWSYCVPGMCHR
jgi:hypothetical protein